TMLGDGRALHLGEHISPQGERLDIQLKGAGKTAYSRGGDGRATLRSMLREYLISEAMHGLGIATSRSLCVIKTGNEVLREKMHEGAVLTRTMKSHIRVGTFEYARYFCETSDLEALFQYTLNRLYPSLKSSSSPVEDLFMEVMRIQIETVSHWMRVGFIHGVMNTDNTSISGETFDYGPCAFMNTYHPHTVFSSIDRHGRYAFGNQPDILKWNLTRWLESLLPLLHDDEDKAIKKAQELLVEFEILWENQYYLVMLQKLGLQTMEPEFITCLETLLALLAKHQLDYTLSFKSLTYDEERYEALHKLKEWQDWSAQWRSFSPDADLMRSVNPTIVPRNHGVEGALDRAVQGDYSLMNQLNEALRYPYQNSGTNEKFNLPPD
ncbi:MAG: hypothetical protein EB023_14915, partial [Flavobacteriia bacterium]|nr:hypothetical protein [Flavobacteriia bacterium]